MIKTFKYQFKYLASALTVDLTTGDMDNTFRMIGFPIIEGLLPIVGTIKEVVKDDQVSRMGVFLQTAAGI